MTTVVDYGVGNVMAFVNYYRRAGLDVTVARTAEELRQAHRVILPGVGSFDKAMQELGRSGMREALEEAALVRKVPVLGVCVGMQMLVAGSDEGVEAGLGWIGGWVRRLPNRAPGSGNTLPLPHMGWNDVTPVVRTGLFAGVEDAARFYFLHSFFVECADPSHVAAVAQYGGEFCCALSAGNIHGVQFHPEKSHHWGAKILSNFAQL